MQAKRAFLRVLMVVLSVLLFFSILWLLFVCLHKEEVPNQPVSAVIPNNVITGDEKSLLSENKNQEETPDNTPLPETNMEISQEKKEPVLSLYKFHKTDNVHFQVNNMFPGDRITQNYGVEVSYEDVITVHFRIELHKEEQKLAEVLKCRVVSAPSGEVFYDGLIKNMPSVATVLRADADTSQVLYYEITAYLDTDVGNAYQNTGLSADFCWWVEEGENLRPPQTGDHTQIVLLQVMTLLSAAMLVFLLCMRRWRDDRHEK